MGELLINAVLVGCGAVGAGYDLKKNDPANVLSHAGAYRHVDGVRLIGCVDPDPIRLAEMSDVYNVEHCFETMADLINADICFDVLSVCTPTSLHREVLEAAFSSPVKAIVCEKPVSEDLNTSQNFVEQAQRMGIAFAVNYFRLWDANVIELARRFQAGEFGAFQGAQAGYVKEVMHNGTHLLTLLQEFLGALEMDCMIHPETERAGRGADFVLRPKCNPKASIQVCAFDAGLYNFFEATLFFEKAVLHFEDGGRRIRLRTPCEHDLYKGFVYPEEEQILPSTQGKAMIHMIEEVVSCAKNGQDFRRNARWCLEAEVLGFEIAGMKRGTV